MTGKRFCREIPLAAIDLEEHPFSAGGAQGLAGLAASLKAVGMLAPPHLRPTASGGYQVVAGFKRLQAAQSLGWQVTPAFLLEPQTPERSCLLLAFHDNAGCRPLNPWEQAFYAGKLVVYLPRKIVVAEYLPLMGLAPAPRLLDRLLAASRLPEPWPAPVAAGRLALSAAARLADWPPESQAAAWPYLDSLPFSRSKQEEFLEWVELLAWREGTSPAAILALPELAAALADPRSSPAERAVAVRQRLKRLVFPGWSRAQETFRAGLKRLGLAGHPRITLTPPSVFEGADFDLTLRFRHAEELEALLNKLARLVHTEDFRRLTSL
jgi:ParB family chromosome partitioning protein